MLFSNENSKITYGQNITIIVTVIDHLLHSLDNFAELFQTAASDPIQVSAFLAVSASPE